MAYTTGTSWSDIPLDLAGRILRRLPAHVDRVRFAAVCPQWRAATRHGPLPPPLPLLLLSDSRVYSLPGSEPFHFPGSTGYTDACGDWLVFSGEEGCFLRDPFSNATVTLPPLSRVRTRLVGTDGGPVWSQAPSTAPTTMKCPPSTRCGRDGGGVLKDEDGLSPGPSLTLEERPLHVDVGDESLDVATLAWMEMAETLKLEMEPKNCKLWLCSSNLIVATIYFTGGQRIAVCQAGATSWWSVWAENLCVSFDDMAFHQGKLYAIDFMVTLFAIDVSVDHSSGDPWISQIRNVIECPCLDIGYFLRGGHMMAYLVESRGVLLVVMRKLCDPFDDLDGPDAAGHNEFEVFEAVLSQSQWLKATTIGNNEILFLSRRCSRSVCAPHNALPGDCIFFLEKGWDHSLCAGSSSCRVYSMTDGKVSNPLPTVSWEPGMVFGTWLFPQS